MSSPALSGRLARTLVASLAAAILVSPAAWGAEAAEEAERDSLYRSLYQQALAARLHGRVQSVRGPLPPEALGFTLMHEHLFVDFLAGFDWPSQAARTDPAVYRRMQQMGWSIPQSHEEREFFNRRELTLDMIEDLRRGWRSRTNVRIDDEREVAQEVRAFTRLGGKAIVDVTPVGLGRDVRRLHRFSEENSVHVVAGTGWYRWPFHPADVADSSVDQLTARLVREVSVGIDGSEIRAGIIGEIPLDSRSIRIPDGAQAELSNDAIRERVRAAEERFSGISSAQSAQIRPEEVYDAQELRVLRAAARASRLTGAALTLHAREPWLGYLPVILDEGVPPARIIIGHAHPHFMERELLERALKSGVVLQADYLLQYYATSSPLGPIDEIADGIAWAVRQGHRDQVLISLDLCYKLGQQKYGGGGYATLHRYLFPKLRQRGVSDADIRHIMVENPKRLLTFASPMPVVRR